MDHPAFSQSGDFVFMTCVIYIDFSKRVEVHCVQRLPCSLPPLTSRLLSSSWGIGGPKFFLKFYVYGKLTRANHFWI